MKTYRIYKTKECYMDFTAPCPSLALRDAEDCGFICRYYLGIKCV